MAKITTYDSHTARTIAQFVRDQQRKAPRRLNNDLSNQRNPRVIRWAKATTNAKYPTYAAYANVFVAQLGDYEFPDEVPIEPLRFPNREFAEYGTSENDYVLVVCENAPLPPQDSIVRIELHDGQWIYCGDPKTVVVYGADASPIYEGGAACLSTTYKAGLRFKDLTVHSHDYQNDDSGTQIRYASDVIETRTASQTLYNHAALRLKRPYSWAIVLSMELTQYGDWFNGATPYTQTYTTTSDGTPAHTHTVDARAMVDFSAAITCAIYGRLSSSVGAWGYGVGSTTNVKWSNVTAYPQHFGGLIFSVPSNNIPGGGTLLDPLDIRFELSLAACDGTYPVGPNAGVTIGNPRIVLINGGRAYLTDWN